ncbi:Rab geranylgeranyltransferase BET2 [Kluyveromyces lactis]|uniref:Geranylgeranyl transferase type-2 subunit beta n=1 Tax=Kluyveromyces lactis (strain ATCC 8585 / CBS 2359 / DSM 70799 / NBRC 1267 / NRRL Y-1140 / WM37) TaxID=284590 RepID=Q6CPH7_KLULA|nr:uncharacterized protein KLLA0_E04797g [Kluyveromyces lactis]CAG99249.1 KLLA0E04797p [Kluyveromyces lactis]|eukprot:XP_454162.1 uncharacterized protein KLLA0_E04797g [Kluyveromyces lactis]
MSEQQLLRDKHIDYIASLDTKKDDLEYWLSEHLRLNGVYWGLTALYLLDSIETFNKEDVIQFVLSCWDHKTGGFAAFPRHDGHLLTTLSGLQILATYNALERLGSEKQEQLEKFILSNQKADGSFQGDSFGEVDTRFVYTALSCLSILHKLTKEVVEPAVSYILRCYNFDGGFGLNPEAESHAAQAFTCIAALAIVGKLDSLTPAQQENIAVWLSERQVPEGGLNGRPSKLPDVCYSWWVLSTLSILQKADWIDFPKLTEFILHCQDPKNGGISDRPDNEVDVFHTVFGLGGLSIMKYPGLRDIDPVYCMPYTVTKYFQRKYSD